MLQLVPGLINFRIELSIWKNLKTIWVSNVIGKDVWVGLYLLKWKINV